MPKPQKLFAALFLAMLAPGMSYAQTPAPMPSPSVSPAPAAGTAASATRFTLANGMTVIVKQDKRAPTAVQLVLVRVGSVDEVDGTSGVAHALEHMMFKGTKDLAVGEFSRRVAALGGRENAFTTQDNTGYYQQIPAGKLEDVMKFESDRFANNQWADIEFTREIEVIKEERRMRTEDSPRAQLYEAANAVAFLASPNRRPVIGWMGDIESMTPNDVREFHKRWYVPSNAVLVVAGDVDPAEVRRLAEKYYGVIPSGVIPARKPRPEPLQVGIRRIEFKAPAEQSYLMMMYKVPKLSTDLDSADSQDALALTVLSAVLDGYAGSRLDRALTQGDNRVADSAGSGNGLMGRSPQMFVLDGIPAAGKTVQELEAALRAQVAKIAADGVSQAELDRVKTQWVASEVYKLDSVFNQARELGSYWIQGFPPEISDQLIARLRAVTADQVKAVAAKYFGDDLLTVGVLVPQPVDKNRKPRPAVAGTRQD